MTQIREQHVASARERSSDRPGRLLIFGFGFTGAALARRLRPKGWGLTGTSRDPQRRAGLEALGVAAIDPAHSADMRAAVDTADAVLIAAPPGDDACPGFTALKNTKLFQSQTWIGYLSTTGVYGDRGGRWVFETAPISPQSPEAHRRAKAEAVWMRCSGGCKVSIFRLPGIYGPGRSPLDRVRSGDARSVVKPGHVFSRVHVDDIAAAIEASISRPLRSGVYNICDDEPAAPADVNAYAARLLGIPPPPEVAFDRAIMSPMAGRFWAESKRASNAKAKATLGWRPRYPTYREGLAALLAAEG